METASLNWDSPENTVEAPQLDPYASVAPTATLPDDVVEKRSKKAQIAFSGETNPPSEDEIKTSIKSNRDDLLRQRLADSEAIRKQGVKQQIIREVVDSGDTSPDAVSFLQGLSADEIVQPQAILEKKYAEWRMNTALAEDDSGTVDKALATDPEGVHSRVDASVDRITRKELIQKHLEDLRAKHDQTGFGRTVIDFIADAVPLYTAVEDKNVYPKNVLAEGFMPGDYRMSANRDLFAMPIEELVSTLDKMSADADQSGDYAPTMKALEAALEYSNKAALTDNAFAILAATDLLPGGLTGDLLFGVGKAATTRGAKVLAKKEALRKAQEAVLGAAQEGGSPKVAKAAGGLPNPPSVDSGIPAPGTAPMAPRPARDAAQQKIIDETLANQSTTSDWQDTANKQAAYEAKQAPKPGPAIWSNAEHDVPVTILDEPPQPGNDGRMYQPVDAGEGKSYLPVDELKPAAPPRPTKEEVAVAAVAEKAAGSPKTLEELAKEIQDSYTIDGRVLPQRPGLQQEYDAALIARQIEDQKTGEVITSFSGNKYKITELDDEAMIRQRANGNNPLGFISMTTEKDGSHSIYINKEKISRAYKDKWWTQGSNGTGFRALPADTFKSEEEFRRFVIEHEITHIDADAHTPWKTLTSHGKIVALEEQVNANTLVKMGKGDAAKKAYPEFFTGKVAGPDPAVVPAPPKIEEIVSDGKPFSKSNLPKKAGPKGEWVDPSARGSSRAPKEAPQYSVEIQKVQKEYQAARKKQTELANQIASPSRHFPDLNAAKLVKKLKELRAQKAAVDKELQRLKRVIDKAPKLNPPTTNAAVAGGDSLHANIDKVNGMPIVEGMNYLKSELERVDRLLKGSDEDILKNGDLKYSNPETARKALSIYKKSLESKYYFFLGDEPHIVVDIPNPRTGGEASVQIPATDENIVRVYADNIEKAALASNETDLANQFVAHGDNDRAALDMAANEVFGKDAVDSAETLARRLPSLVDPTAAVTGTAKHSGLYKLVLKEKERWKNVIARQAAVNESLGKVWDNASKGALRWSEQVFEAAKPAMREQMDKFIGTPSSAIKDISIDYLREFDTGLGRTNQIVYRMGTPDGQFFDSVAKANTFARDFYKLAPGTYSVELRTPTSYMLRVAKVIDETDPNILKHAIQTETKTPVSWVNTFMGYLRGSAGVSSDFLQANLAASAHHAKALHDAFMVAAKDIGTLSKKEFNNLEALMEAKRDVEKTVYDPVSRQEKKVRGEWFESAADLERTYKRAFGEFPSENVISAYFTMRQMYDFDLLYRNYRLYSQKSRLGIENARLFIPIEDWRNPGMVNWVQMEKGIEAKFVDEIPAGKIADVLILDPETAQANLVNTGKSGLEGIKALREKGYRIMQLANPDQRPLRMVNDNYIQYVVAKDVERHPLTPDQLPATAGGHIRYKEGFFVKQPRYEVTSNGQKLYLGDRSILGASSSAEAAKHAAAMEKGRQLLVAGDMQGLKEHLKNNLPWTVGQFENLFIPKLGNKGNVIEEAALDKSTPITWVADGQGTNDAAKTHAAELRSHFEGVRDTIDDDTNLYRVLDKKFTGEKDFSLQKIIQGDNGPLWKFDKARMVSPMETLEQAWAEVSRSMATDNLKIQAMTNWVEEAADVLQTPIEELRKNPWEALNNPQWNRQYADVARVRTLDAQRRQIIAFLGQKDALGSTLDWMRNKLMDSVFDKKGGAAADWVDDHLLPNVKNPLSFMRSFAFHAKMGFFNPIQLFLQSATMVNTFAITGNPARVGSALSGVMLMHAARVNRTPEILGYLAKKSEKLGWKPGEWLEMEKTFRDLSLHLVEGEVGTLDVMTNPSVYKSKLGMALDKGLVFFREAERNVRANAWAVAYKEFRDANPTKVLNNEDINKILRRQEILSGNMTRGSNALWQHGLTGPMTQFWGYQARITEQLLGKQLSKAEKLRLGLSMAAMYGIPVSIGAGTFMQIPGASTDDIRQYAQDHGIDINSGLASVAMNGIPAEVIRWATSDENGQNGLLFNIGDRYGPGGLPVLKNLVEAKDGMVDAVVDLTFGASGSIFRDFAKHMLPDSWDVLESATNAPNLTLNDFAGMFSTVSTISNMTKLLWALQTHKAYTRDGLELGDKSVASAFVSFSTGLDEQWVKDTMLKMDSMKDLKAANDELKKEYIKQIRAAMQLPSGSPEREARIRKARGLAIGIDPNEFKKWVKDSVRPAGSLKESVDKQYEKKVLNR